MPESGAQRRAARFARAWGAQPLALTGSGEWLHSRAARLPRRSLCGGMERRAAAGRAPRTRLVRTAPCTDGFERVAPQLRSRTAAERR